LQLIAFVNQRIVTIEADLQQIANNDPEAALLQTHPGIGFDQFLALRYPLLYVGALDGDFVSSERYWENAIK